MNQAKSYSRSKLVWQTVASVFTAMKENKLQALIPATVIVLGAAIGLYFINLVSPLAPFVYSLF